MNAGQRKKHTVTFLKIIFNKNSFSRIGQDVLIRYIDVYGH
jgi:hypothetical protein